MSKRTDDTRSIARFGEKLRILRTRHGLTLQDLARKMGLSAHGYISELEHNRKSPTAEFVLGISRIFNVTTDELLKDELEIKIESGRLSTDRTLESADSGPDRTNEANQNSSDTEHNSGPF